MKQISLQNWDISENIYTGMKALNAAFEKTKKKNEHILTNLK